MVDYKKWDKFVANLSSDEEDNNKKPRVTTLPSTTGGRVTIGPQGYAVHEDVDEEDDKEYWNEDEEMEKGGLTSIRHSMFSGHQNQNSKTSDRVEWIEDSDSKTPAIQSSSGKSLSTAISSTTNGGEGTYNGCKYKWSQDRHEVTLSISLPSSPLQYSKRSLFLYYDEIQKKLCLFYSPSLKKDTFFNHFKSINYDVERIAELANLVSNVVVAFTGNMQYAIQLTGDVNNPFDEVIDWELIKQADEAENTFSYRVEMVLVKLCPIANATLWWERVFLGEPKIDVTKIAGRSSAQHGKDTLQQAHELFLKRIREQQKIEIDANSDSDEENGI